MGSMSVFCVRHLEVTTDITHFLPQGADRRTAVLARAMADSELTRTMILSIAAPDTATAVDAATQLAGAIRSNPEVAWIRHGVDRTLERSVYDLYFPRRLYFLSDEPERELPVRLSDAGLAAAAREVKRQLQSPASSLVARIAGADPLLSFPQQLRRMREHAGTLTLESGQFVTMDRRHSILFVGTTASAFATRHQAPLLADIDRAFVAVNGAHGGALTFERTGVNRFAVASELSMRRDMTRISGLSTAGVVLLFLVLFRSPRYLFLALLPLLAGMLGGMSVAILAFGKLHGLTLAFGSSLIGVCIDYPILYLNHHTLHPDPAGPAASLRRIWVGLQMGSVTTMAGFAGMAWMDMPGLREIALFSSAGVLAALLCVRFMLPALVPIAPRPVALQRRSAQALGAALERLRGHRRALMSIPAVGIATCVVGLPLVRWSGDLAALSKLDPEMTAEDARVRARVSSMDSGRFVLAMGRDEESALDRNDRVAERLEAARTAGSIEDFQSLHSFLWSRDLQRRNRTLAQQQPQLFDRTLSAFSAEGFRPDGLREFGEALRGPWPDPLTFDRLRLSPLYDAVRPFRATLQGEIALLTLLRGVRDPEALSRSLADLEGVSYIDQPQFLHDTYVRLRTHTIALIGAGLVGVFALVYGRYRFLALALAAFLPAVLAAATTVAIFALAGVEQNILHLLGLLLVLSMGVDYGIFMAESHRRAQGMSTTLLSVVLACLTTVLSFGLLAMSANPALRALGMSTGVGILLSFLYAPIALLLHAPGGAEP